MLLLLNKCNKKKTLFYYYDINLKMKNENILNKKVISTRTSHAVPHHSTNLAFSRLTSEFGRDPVL